MEGLASVCDGTWEAGGEGTARTYLLVPKTPETEPYDADRLQEAGERDRARHDSVAGASGTRAARVDLYRRSLGLSKEQVLEKLEKPDPWACADLLDPFTRPLVTWVCSLSEADQNALLADGEMAWPLHAVPANASHTLAKWATDTRHPPMGHGTAVGPDTLPRFNTPEERWANSSHKAALGNERARLGDRRAGCFLLSDPGASHEFEFTARGTQSVGQLWGARGHHGLSRARSRRSRRPGRTSTRMMRRAPCRSGRSSPRAPGQGPPMPNGTRLGGWPVGRSGPRQTFSPRWQQPESSM